MYSPIDEIKNKLDIVEIIQGYIRLQKAGRNYRALCPFHSEKNPSFMVSPERQTWRCFGCSKGGSIFDFIMEIEGVEFGDALRILAQRAGVELKKIDPKLKTERTRLYEICELATRFFERQLEASKTGQLVQKYLRERGLKPKTIQEWRLGYAPNKWQALSDFLEGRGYGEEEILKAGLGVQRSPDERRRPDESQRPVSDFRRVSTYDRFRNRIIFPICDLNGIVIGFSARIFGQGEPKYINTPNTLIYDKSRVLYGLDKAKLALRKENLAVLVEGQMDVLMSHQAGLRNVIASSGTALTEGHLRLIKRYTENLATAFDMDLAGETATKRSIDLAIAAGFNTKIIQIPTNEDPADCLKNNPSIWSEAIQKACSMIDFYFSTAFSKFNPALVEGKKAIAKILLPVLKRIPNKIEQAHWVQELARRLKTEEKTLVEEMRKIKETKLGTVSSLAEEGLKISQNKEKQETNQLEEYLLSLLLVHPQLFKDFENQPSYLFTNSDLAELFKRMKKSQILNLKSFQKTLSADLAGRVDYLVFRAETEQKEDFDLNKEIEFCFTQLKNRYYRQKLTQLNLAIKEAEDKKDTTALKNLTEEFNKLSKQLTL